MDGHEGARPACPVCDGRPGSDPHPAGRADLALRCTQHLREGDPLREAYRALARGLKEADARPLPDADWRELFRVARDDPALPRRYVVPGPRGEHLRDCALMGRFRDWMHELRRVRPDLAEAALRSEGAARLRHRRVCARCHDGE